MKVKFLGPPALASILLLLVSVPIFAHHGAASYDITKMTTLKGTVTSIQWMNPHAEIDMEVNDAADSSIGYSSRFPSRSSFLKCRMTPHRGAQRWELKPRREERQPRQEGLRV